MTYPRDDVAIIVFARRPSHGKVKTRLIPKLGSGGAARLYAQLLDRTIEIVERAHFEARILMPAADDELDFFRARLSHRGWSVEPQCSGDLGARMRAAFATFLARHCAALLIGTDIADLQVRDLDQARAALCTGSEAVIGPSVDGGYWLIALDHAEPGIFEDIPWSSARVYAETASKLKRRGLHWAELCTRCDIDRPEDLRGVGEEITQRDVGPWLEHRRAGRRLR